MDQTRIDEAMAKHSAGIREKQTALTHEMFLDLLAGKKLTFFFSQGFHRFLSKPAYYAYNLAITLYFAIPGVIFVLCWKGNTFLYLGSFVAWVLAIASGSRHDNKSKSLFDIVASPILLAVSVYLVQSELGKQAKIPLGRSETIWLAFCLTFIVTKGLVRIANLIYQYNLLGQARKSSERFEFFKDIGALITSFGLADYSTHT